MPADSGKIVLMGSGELTATMVEVHKELIAGLSPPRRAVFLDTPAGFQLNVEQISKTAVLYFKTRVQKPLGVASFKSADSLSAYEAETAFHTLRNAQLILIGPGSPTYAVRQMQNSPIPDIFGKLIKAGGCLVAASAAALTVGAYTLPVYEIYKVGEAVHWVDGLDVLAAFGFDLVVVPHWNNAEGGTHDTRRCFMGESRFRVLEGLLPKGVGILGLDEHTACIIDLSAQQVTIRGIGRVIVKHGEKVRVFTKGDVFTADVLRGVGQCFAPGAAAEATRLEETGEQSDRSPFWTTIHALERDFHEGLAERDTGKVTNSLLEMDRAIWKGKQDLESDETISEAREMLRDQIVAVGSALAEGPGTARECVEPVVSELLELRERFRRNRQFHEADALRESLQRAHIHVEDTPDGVRWRMHPP
jgi:hypothetical protein